MVKTYRQAVRITAAAIARNGHSNFIPKAARRFMRREMGERDYLPALYDLRADAEMKLRSR